MLRAYRYRIYPNREQECYFFKSFGCARFVYNRTLDYVSMMWNGAQQSISRQAAQTQLPGLKEIYPWLKEVNAQSLQHSVAQVFHALQKFWNHSANYPHLRKKDVAQSFHNPQDCFIDWAHSTISIPKCRDIRIVLSRGFHGNIKDVVIDRQPDGKFYACIIVDTFSSCVAPPPVREETMIGIDTGIHSLAVCSDGRTYDVKHFSDKSARRLRHYQRKFRHMTKDSRNWKTNKKHIAKIEAHVRNQRLDYVHKITCELVHDNQVETICIENINASKWHGNKQISSIANDACVGEFYRQLRYKCKWYGVNLITIDKWAPSSRTCSVCGEVNHSLRTNERVWTCKKCGAHHDRDKNASLNIKSFGLKTLPVECRKVTPADYSTVDERMFASLRSSDRLIQEKFGSVSEAENLFR